MKNNKHTTKKSMCNLNETYRVTVAVVGRCGLPTVGIPLFLPWLNDEELRGRVGCSIDDDGVISSTDDWGNAVRRCGPTWDRVGAINGLLLTSLSKPFSLDGNCLVEYVEPKSFDNFLPFRWTNDDGAVWTFEVLLKVVCEPR